MGALNTVYGPSSGGSPFYNAAMIRQMNRSGNENNAGAEMLRQIMGDDKANPMVMMMMQLLLSRMMNQDQRDFDASLMREKMDFERSENKLERGFRDLQFESTRGDIDRQNKLLDALMARDRVGSALETGVATGKADIKHQKALAQTALEDKYAKTAKDILPSIDKISDLEPPKGYSIYNPIGAPAEKVKNFADAILQGIKTHSSDPQALSLFAEASLPKVDQMLSEYRSTPQGNIFTMPGLKKLSRSIFGGLTQEEKLQKQEVEVLEMIRTALRTANDPLLLNKDVRQINQRAYQGDRELDNLFSKYQSKAFDPNISPTDYLQQGQNISGDINRIIGEFYPGIEMEPSLQGQQDVVRMLNEDELNRMSQGR